ncbi:MAG: VCBS repeat-containing protein, partial [Candidatus Marinimicrobia bacterium]|nr:VCBS repeat-containing protein [Candidatus Neomarinimicrobiota bacterium]
MKAHTLILSTVLLLSGVLFGQTFTRINTGNIVNEGAPTYGAAWGDYNDNGYIDLFVANVADRISSLFRNNGDGSFTKLTSGAIADAAVSSIAASWGDYDNDGDLDLIVCSGEANNLLFANNGDGTFSRITAGVIIADIGGNPSWGDYDNDGYLDLFITTAGRNLLYHNNKDGTFTKITTGRIVTDNGSSNNGSWGDYNSDSYLDLFVSNGSDVNVDNFLYTNNGDGTFTKITTGAIVNDGGMSMGASWADYDNDGDLDLFVTNGSSFESQDNFLYQNNGDGTFERILAGNIVNDGGYSWSCAWGDMDNDGDLDLFVTNNPGDVRGSNSL